MYIDHTQTYIIKYARIWRKTWIALLISRKEQGRITTNCSDPASSSQQEALLHLMKILDHPTLWCYNKKPTTLPHKIQNSSLWISGMRDPYIDICKGDEWACVLISVLPLIVLASTWRLMISYSSLVEFREASVTGESYGRFHAFPPCKMTLPFVSFPISAPHRRASCS